MPEQTKAADVVSIGGNRAETFGGRASVSARDITPQSAGGQIERLPIVGPRGQVIAVIVGDTLTKSIDGWSHMLHNPVAIAIDAGAVAQAERLGVKQIAVTDRTSGRVYSCMMRDFLAYSWRLDRGYGPQIAMRLARFHTDGATPATAPTPEPARPAAVQLGLFGVGA